MGLARMSSFRFVRSLTLPVKCVRKLIAGDELVMAHGSREMPIWGPIFHQIERDQDLGEIRLQNVTKYLESIQTGVLKTPPLCENRKLVMSFRPKWHRAKNPRFRLGFSSSWRFPHAPFGHHQIVIFPSGLGVIGLRRQHRRRGKWWGDHSRDFLPRDSDSPKRGG